MKTSIKALILCAMAMVCISSCGAIYNTYNYADITQDSTTWEHALIGEEGKKFSAPCGSHFFYDKDGEGVTIQGGSIVITHYESVRVPTSMTARREMVRRFRELESTKYNLEETMKEFPDRKDFKEEYKSINAEMENLNDKYFQQYGISIKQCNKRRYIKE